MLSDALDLQGVIRTLSSAASFAFVMAASIFLGSKTSSAPFLLMIFILKPPWSDVSKVGVECIIQYIVYFARVKHKILCLKVKIYSLLINKNNNYSQMLRILPWLFAQKQQRNV